ncbi:hypothetical protein LEMLEM_LOCUS26798, partial [Lemmus lemmus]
SSQPWQSSPLSLDLPGLPHKLSLSIHLTEVVGTYYSAQDERCKPPHSASSWDLKEYSRGSEDHACSLFFGGPRGSFTA